MLQATVAEQMDVAWDSTWKKFFLEETSLFYEFFSSDKFEDRFKHLPTPEEINQDIPNITGWTTGMEDASINAGVMMECVVSRYAVTGEASMREYAEKIFKGMVLCAEVHGTRGFIARSVSPYDKKSIYKESSRDQYTHYVQGLFKYYHSPLAGDEQRAKIREIIVAICEFMETYVKPETNYTFPMVNLQQPGYAGICQMWERNAWADARLPMIYAAGWSLAGNRHCHELFRRYAHDALDRTLQMPLRTIVAAIQYQIQCSLELIYNVAVDDEALREKCLRAMRMVAELSVFSAWVTRHDEKPVDFSKPHPDWRKIEAHRWDPPYEVPIIPEEITAANQVLRYSCQAAINQFMTPGWNFSNSQKRLLLSRLKEVDYETCAYFGIFSAITAYWKGRATGWLTEADMKEAAK